MATAQEEKRKSFADLSIETSLIFDRLKKAEVGEVVHYAEIEKLAARPMPKVYGNIRSAMNKAEREEGLIFDAVRGEGVKRLDPHGAVGKVERGRHQVARKTRRLMRTASRIAVGELSSEDKNRFNLEVTMLGTLNAMFKPVDVKALAAAVEKQGNILPKSKALELFASK